MRKTLLLLLLLFFALSLFAQEPIIKFYLNDGSQPKEYNIEEIENIGIMKNGNNNIMKLFYQDSLSVYYPVVSIDSIKFEIDTSNIQILSFYVFGIKRSYVIMDIDSICFNNISLKISEKAKDLDSLAKDGILSIDSNSIILNKNISNIKDLEVGDFIVSGKSKNTPSGLMKKVISIIVSGDSTIIKVEDAKITDIVESGIIIVHKQITPDDTLKTSVQKGVSLDKTLEHGEFKFGIKDFELPIKDPFKVTFNGQFVLTMDFSFSIVIENYTIQQILFQSTNELSLDLNVSLNASGKFNIETPFFKSILAAIPTPIPFIFVTPTLDLLAQCEFELSGGAQVGYNPKIQLTGGFEYNNGIIKPIFNFSSDFQPKFEPEVTVELNVKPSFGPKLNMNINSIEDALNAFTKVTPYCKLEADLLKFPCWDLIAGVEANAGLTSKWLGKKFEIPLNADFHTTLMKVAPSITNLQPSSAMINDIITINGNCFGDDRNANSFVFFNKIAATDFISWNNHQIEVRVPEGAKNGELSVVLKDALIEAKSNEVDFKVIDYLEIHCNNEPIKKVIDIGEKYYLNNDTWGSDEEKIDVTQCIFKKESSFGWKWDLNDKQLNAVNYPCVTYGINPWNNAKDRNTELPLELKNIKSISITYKANSVFGLYNIYNLSFDLWLLKNGTTPSDKNIEYEIMVWEDKSLLIFPLGNLIESNIFGNYDLYRGTHDNGFLVYSFFPTNNALISNRTINLMDFINYLIDKKYIKESSVLSSISFGNEIRRGSGKTEIEDYSISIHDLSRDCTIAGTTYDSETTEINVANMELTELPDCIGGLINLEKLDAWNNNFTELPASIGNLNKLEILALADNSLTYLPESIKNLSNNLKILDLENNPITDSEKIKIQNWLPNTTIYW